MNSILIVAAALLSLTGAAQAESGMFLCPSPLLAHDYWAAVSSALQSGFPAAESLRTLAPANKCQYVAGDDLRPIGAGWAGMIKITDGRVFGWADPALFNWYAGRQRD
jgi:hypothetical protein